MNEESKVPSVSYTQEQFENIVRSGALKVCERSVFYAADRDDRVQEGLAFAWQFFLKQAMVGRTPDTALVVHVAKLRTKDRRRRFVPGGGTRWGEDVFVQQERGLELRRLHGVHDHDDEEHHDEDPGLGLARLGAGNPERNLLSALDLVAWLDGLSATDREMLELRGAGYELQEVGDATGRSVAAVFRRTHVLGLDLAERAGVEVVLSNRGRPRHAHVGGE